MSRIVLRWLASEWPLSAKCVPFVLVSQPVSNYTKSQGRRTPYYRLNHLHLLAIGPGASGPSQLRERGPGERIWPPSVPGTFVINVGTMLASYSNDRVRMT